jgi:hypothetical protein
MHNGELDTHCATFLANIADEVPVERFEAYAADVEPYLPPEVLQQLRHVEHLLAEARNELLGAGQRLAAGRPALGHTGATGS